MRLTLFTREDLYELGKAIIKNSTNVAYPFAKGTLHRAFVELASLFSGQASAQTLRLISGTILEGLTGNMLKRRGLEDGVEQGRSAPARAQGYFVPAIIPAPAAYTVTAGVSVIRPATSTQSKIQFRVEATATIPIGASLSNTISIVAIEKGTKGNGITSGTQLQLEYPIAGVSHLLLTSDTGGGLDTQSDVEYRTSIREAKATFAEGSWAGITSLLKGVSIDSGARVTVARVVEDFVNDTVTSYIDDGSGDSALIGPIDSTSYPFASHPNNYWEYIPTGIKVNVRLPYSHLPGWADGVTEQIEFFTGGSWGVWVTLAHNVDYYVNEDTGQIAFVVPLTVGQIIRVWFRFYHGLVGECAKFVNGMEGSTTIRGWRPVGRSMSIRPPTSVLKPSVSADITFNSGFDSTFGRAVAKDVVEAYLQGLDVGESARYDVVNGILHKVKGVKYVTNLLLAGGNTDVPPATTYGVIRADAGTIVL